ncbi:protein of unknown function [Methylorubrum extorquens]|uniref:Uncharacterized protein n=1 Tax=Methylorubrum extorquens TaxID=408 RepID=A0A2N9AYV7_METEX|nr:protein of unknown function [Methylorubrum extorquens]
MSCDLRLEASHGAGGHRGNDVRLYEPRRRDDPRPQRQGGPLRPYMAAALVHDCQDRHRYAAEQRVRGCWNVVRERQEERRCGDKGAYGSDEAVQGPAHPVFGNLLHVGHVMDPLPFERHAGHAAHGMQMAVMADPGVRTRSR